MKELEGNKKLEVARLYILGLSYKEIEKETGVSHGSIVNIVKEIEGGKLDIPGTPFDQVNELHQLSSDLKKNGLSTSQALLGLSFFERALALSIFPEHLERWAQLMNRLTVTESSVADFLNAALRLHQLEDTEGKAYELLIEEYEKVEEDLGHLKLEANSLAVNKTTLTEEVGAVSSQVEGLRKTKDKLETEVDGLTIKVKNLKSKVDENMAESVRLDKEVREIKRRKVKLYAEVDGKEESLIRLNDMGFLDEDLLRLKAILDRTARDSGLGQKEVKERFFTALGTFKDIIELQKSQAAEAESLKGLTKERSFLIGEIAGLEKQRDILRGEIEQSASSAVKEITDTGEKAAIQLRQQAEDMEGRLDGLFDQALKVAGVIGEMNAMIKKGEESGRSLDSFIEEARVKLEKN
jgi:chromosome segregation ATPase